MSNSKSSKKYSSEIKVVTDLGCIAMKHDEKTSVRILEISGKKYVDIRKLWKPEDKQEYLPTKKGIVLSYDSLIAFEKMLTIVKEGLKAA